MSHPFHSACWSFAVTALSLVAGVASAQTTWEFDPYEVEIWVVAGESPQITPSLLDELRAELQTQAAIAIGAPWRTTVAAPPVELAADVALTDFDLPISRLKEFAAGTLRREKPRRGPPPADGVAATPEAAKPDLVDLDKLISVRVDRDARGYVVTARQLDLRSRQWSPAYERATPQRESLGMIAWEAVLAAFTPMARIEKLEPATVTTRMRAGGLIVDPETNPAGLRKGDALAAVIRRNDRNGEPLKTGGIQTAPWTALVVKERENSLLRCDLHTGVRSAIPSRGGPRTERLALRVTPRFNHTDLLLQARTKDSQPLEGFEVFSRPPGTEENNLVGRTDWRGILEIPPIETSPVQTLYIRSGGKVVAKLPLIAGLEERASIRLPDDGRRLHAEGLVAAMQSRVTDLVARQQIHAARIRGKLKQGKPEEAKPLLEEMRTFETRADLLRDLDDYVANVKSSDRSTQFRIDKLFGDARKLLGKFLDPQLVNQLAAEIDQAIRNPQPTEPNPPADVPAPTTPEPQPTPPVTPETPVPTPQPIPVPPPTTQPMQPVPGSPIPGAPMPTTPANPPPQTRPRNDTGLKTGL